MSRTDKTRPWWVQLTDAPGRTCLPEHDHRFGPCTLPDLSTIRGRTAADRVGCHWDGTPEYWVRRLESHGAREWNVMRRQERRRERHEARRELREAVRRVDRSAAERQHRRG